MDPFERLRYVARRGSGSSSEVAVEAAPAFSALAGEPGALLTAARRLLDFHPACGPLWWMAAQVLSAADPELAAAFATAELEEDPTAVMAGAAIGERAPAVVVALATAGDHLLPALAAARPPAVRLVAEPWVQRRLMIALSAAAEAGGGDRGGGDGGGGGEEDERGRRRGGRRGARRPRREGPPAPAPDLTGWEPEEAEEALEGADLALVDVLAGGPAGVVVPPGGRALARAAGRRRVPLWAVGGVGRVLPEPLFDLLVARLGRGAGAGEVVAAGDLAAYAGPAGAADARSALTASDCPVPVELLRRAR